MANRTNSNSLVSLTINKFNDKTKGFRYEMLKVMGLNDETVFEDGTHSSIEVKEINKKQVDIIAKYADGNAALIEVKVGVNEDLQPSQAKKGEYERVAKKYDLKLFYIIPENYSHQDDLPTCAEIITWEEILKMESVKGTTFANEIKYFVEINREGESNVIENTALFTSMFTKFLIAEGMYREPSSYHNDRLDEFITWYDLTDGEELSIGISNENGNVYLYVSEELFEIIDSNKYARVINQNETSVYSVLFNLMEDVDKEDIEEYESVFLEKFWKKIRKIEKLAKENL